MADIIQLRRDTAANWTSANPILAQGEAGVELDTNNLKIGDGSTAWNSLDYAIPSPTIIAVTSLTDTWTLTTTNSYEELGYTDATTNLRVEIAATSGDRIEITPPSVSFSQALKTRLQRSTDGGSSWTDILLGDAATGKEQVTWGVNYSGANITGVFYYGSTPLGNSVFDTAPSTGTMLYRIMVKINTSPLYLGRNVDDSGPYNARFPSFISAKNWGQ